ncbi:SMI1/KNR4 family protein [Pectobacterium brasiliense]|uniref:SMI1/KNR4 family protein n=1 Tax=Pectobacterium brasiliense TaxID=180957 RepID=A0AAE3BDC4_9GAMM|nr:SMI1/KNR4 family protein [Pectobacterium brasiliense]MBN3050214.1 SMI1/KNR4 family protein [Pectobacterium brasiliense]
MDIEKKDLLKWEVSDPEIVVERKKSDGFVMNIEKELSITLPNEYRDYIFLTANQTSWPKDDCGYFLAKYNDRSLKVLMSVLFPYEEVIDSTKLLQESIYEHRFLLSQGLIIIGCDYDDFSDGYLVYDVRRESPTYQNIFHWMYSQGNLIVGEGLGFIAHSLKEFLNTPTAANEL